MINKELVIFYENLLKLREQCKVHFPAKVSYAITRNIRILSNINDDIASTRAEILREHAEPKEDKPGYFQAKPGHEEILIKELQSIDEAETEVMIHKISFNDITNMELSIAEMDALYFMIEDEQEEEN